MTEWRVTPEGEKQWRSADGYWYPTESAALLAGLQPVEHVAPLPLPIAPSPPHKAPGAGTGAPAPNAGKRGPLGISLPGATYLGGHPSQKGKVNGNLIVRDGLMGIGIGRVPKLARIVLSPGLPMRVESAVIAKSRAGKVLAFGVVGLAARSQQNTAYVTADMGSTAVTYQVVRMTGPELAARLREPLGAYGVKI